MKISRAPAYSALLTIFLAGCGGGGGWQSPITTPPESETADASATSPAAVGDDAPSPGQVPVPPASSELPSSPLPLPTTQLRYSYKMGAVSSQDSAAVLAGMRKPECAGHRPVGALFAGPSDLRPLYQSVNAIAAFEARLLPAATSISLFDLPRVKFEGASGFVPAAFFVAPASGGLSEMYLRPQGSTVTFQSRGIQVNPFSGQASSGLLAQMNALGANGYFEHGRERLGCGSLQSGFAGAQLKFSYSFSVSAPPPPLAPQRQLVEYSYNEFLLSLPETWRQVGTATYNSINFQLRIQPVDATVWLNISAGVRKLRVFLGLSFSLRANALSWACE